jgi:putative transcriptional regulator
MTMGVSYNKLWKLLIDKGMKKKDLRDGVEMSSNTLAKLGRNEYVALDVLVRTCDYLHCDIGDIMEVIPDKKDIQG